MPVMSSLPANTPTSANRPMMMPSLTSTWPNLARLTAPTNAFGNLCAMLLATATMPGASRLIIAGVSMKAPPEPMKPLTKPPMKPTTNSNSTLTRVSSGKLRSMPRLLAPVPRSQAEAVPKADGECPVYQREHQRDRDRHDGVELLAPARGLGERRQAVAVPEQQRVEQDAGGAQCHHDPGMAGGRRRGRTSGRSLVDVD